MTAANSYDREAAEVQQKRDRTPRASALLSSVFEAMGHQIDEEKRRSLESLAFALGLYVKFGEDLTDAGEISFAVRFARIVGPAR